MDPVRVAEASRGQLLAGQTALRLIVGIRLRRLREAAAITEEHAGSAIRASHSKISRLETGKSRFKPRDLKDLLTLYNIRDDAERAEFLALAALANQPSWWSAYGDVVPAWFAGYLGLEQAATLIRSYDAQVIPDLLQTPEYARAAIRLGHEDATEDEIGRRVELRMKRQQILFRADPVKLWVILDEAVLHRPLGSTASMRAQLDYLIRAAELPHVTIQLLPFSIGGHLAASGPMTILRFAENEIPDMVYLEHLATASYYDKPADVVRYWDVMNRLTLQAEHPEATLVALDRGPSDVLRDRR